MTHAEILEKLAEILPDHAFKTACLAPLESCEFSTPQELEKFLTNWQKATGWLARQSGVVVFSAGQPVQQNGLGFIVGGELAKGNESLKIVRMVDGWRVIRIRETGNDPHFCDEVRHLTVEHGTAVYRRYWTRSPDDGAVSLVASRFVGFEEETT